MKKIFLIIVVLCLTLCGCKNNTSQQEAPTLPPVTEPTIPVETPQEIETEPVVEEIHVQQPMNAIALPIITEMDETRESSFTYQDIYLFCQDQEVADRVILDFLNRQDTHRNVAYSANQYEILFSPTRIDGYVLSLFGNSILHQGGNHPIVECQSANYNMFTGEVLTLGSILKSSDAHIRIIEELQLVAESVADAKQLYPDYSQVIEDRFNQNPSFDEEWFFSSTGLSFYFEPYEIAPYTAGVITLEIPYNQLVGLIDDSFFPAEEDLSKGNLNVYMPDDINLNNYTQIAEIRLGTTTEAIFLCSEGLLRDVRIEMIDNNSQTSRGTIFAAYTISAGDGIILMYDHTITPLQLQITYRSAEAEVTQGLYLTADGSFILS